jgi:hypothetical protein
MVFGTVLNLATTLSLSCLHHPDQCANRSNKLSYLLKKINDLYLNLTNQILASSSYPPPIIQYGHQNQTLMINDMAIMPCQATGRVPAKITWLKDGLELDLNATDHKGRYRQLPVGTLQISDLK